MNKRFLIMVLLLIGILSFAGNAFAQVNVNINTTGAVADYLAAAATLYGFTQGDVTSLNKLNVAPSEVPVVFYTAKTAGVSPVTIAKDFLAGKSWTDIAKMFNISPSAYYVAPPTTATTTTVSGPPYGNAWGYYKKWPKNQWTWQNIKLTNADVTNLVNAKFLSQYYGYPMGQIISMRVKGLDFKSIHSNIVKQKKENAKAKLNKDKNEKSNDKQGNNSQNGNGKGKAKGKN